MAAPPRGDATIRTSFTRKVVANWRYEPSAGCKEPLPIIALVTFVVASLDPDHLSSDLFQSFVSESIQVQDLGRLSDSGSGEVAKLGPLSNFEKSFADNDVLFQGQIGVHQIECVVVDRRTDSLEDW